MLGTGACKDEEVFNMVIAISIATKHQAQSLGYVPAIIVHDRNGNS